MGLIVDNFISILTLLVQLSNTCSDTTLKRWLLRPSETPPPILPDPWNAETPEKAETMVHANAEVEKILTTKRKRVEYNHYNSEQHVLRWQDMQLNMV